MPELAEVEYFRTRWNKGLGSKVLSVHLNPGKKVFRGTDTSALEKVLTGATFEKSEAHGKQLLFRFTKNAWLGLHMGMTGELRVEPPCFEPLKHDHLILRQARQSLVFNDPRQFGRGTAFVNHRNFKVGWFRRPTDDNSPSLLCGEGRGEAGLFPSPRAEQAEQKRASTDAGSQTHATDAPHKSQWKKVCPPPRNNS